MGPGTTPPSVHSAELRTPVLATTSIQFYVRGEPYTDNQEAIDTIDAVTEKLRAALQAAFGEDTGVEVIGTVSFRYPNEEGANVYRCAKCSQLLTDDNQPNPCDGLMDGYLVSGEYLCRQHYEIAVKSGAIPRPPDYWTSEDETL